MSTPDFYIYLDEFEKGNMFCLSAAFIPPNKTTGVLKDWNRLRHDIKEILLRDYPRAIYHPNLQGDKLPEIHAVDLFQSVGYYRKYKHGSKENSEDQYWLQHYDWLEESLEIIKKHEIQCFYLPFKKSLAKHIEQDTYNLINRFDESIPKKKIQNLIYNGYLHTLPTLLIAVENWLRNNNLTGEIICDDHSMSKGFSVNTVIDLLREGGQYTNLSTPRFANGLDEPLLQVSDVLCYVRGRVSHLVDNNFSPTKATQADLLITRWNNNYLTPLVLDIPIFSKETNRYANHHVGAIMLEVIIQEAIKNKSIKDQIRLGFEDVFKLKGD